MITFTRDDAGLALLRFDFGGAADGIFSKAFLTELDAAVTRVAQEEHLTGVILLLKDAGPEMEAAEIRARLSLQGTAVGRSDQLRAAGAVLRRLETCGRPVVAAICGSATGAGFELALACHRRIALNDPGSLMGLSQVRSGLMPALGGTQRLPRLISIPKALPLLLEGQLLAPEDALAAGLVHELAGTPEDLMARAAAWCLSAPAAQQPWDVKGFRIPGGAGPLAPFATREFQNGTSRLKAASGDNPAPRAILSAVYEGTLLPIDTALKIEADFCAVLLGGGAGAA